jgi:hypothetical protein
VTVGSVQVRRALDYQRDVVDRGVAEPVDLDRYRQRLYLLHERMQREGGFTERGYRYLIEARKP